MTGAMFGAALLVQAVCGPAADIQGQLAGKYGERLTGSGHAPGGVVIEVWANVDTGTWTILSVGQTGVACVAATGGLWKDARGTAI